MRIIHAIKNWSEHFFLFWSERIVPNFIKNILVCYKPIQMIERWQMIERYLLNAASLRISQYWL